MTTTLLRSSALGVIPPLLDPDEPKIYEQTQHNIMNEELFDGMMKRCNSMAIPAAFEPLLCEMFQASRAVVWLETSDNTQFHAPTLNRSIHDASSLVSATAIAKTAINCVFIDDQIALDQLAVERESPQLFFPLYLRTGPVIGVCQVSRASRAVPFGEVEMGQACFVMRKFVVYGTCTLNSARTVNFASEIAQVSDKKETIARLENNLKSIFKCETIDFWVYRPDTNVFAAYDPSLNEFTLRHALQVGIVSHALRAKQFINERARKFHVNYVEALDGDGEAPLLVGADSFDSHNYAVAMRGRTNGKPFSIDDDKRIEIVMPFVSRSLAFSFKFLTNGHRHVANELQLPTQVLDSAISVTSSTGVFTAIDNIELHAMKVGSASVCRLFVLDPEKQVFRYNFSESAKVYNERPLQGGIVGDVYKSEEPRAVNETDNEENVELVCVVHNMMAVPVFSSFDKLVAVLVLANKVGSGRFTDHDIDQVTAYSVFCGIALQNVKALDVSLSIVCQFEQFGTRFFDPRGVTPLRAVVERVFENSQKVIGASRITVYLLADKKLVDVATVGERGHITSHEFAEAALVKHDQVTFSVLSNSSILHHPSLFSSKMTDDVTGIVGCAPLCTTENEMIGVLEIECSLSGSPGDIDHVRSFVRSAALFVERAQFKKLAAYGCKILEVERIFLQDESVSFDTPDRLQSTDLNLLTFEFSARELGGDDIFKAVFSIFDAFNLKDIFSISNGKLYSLLTVLSESYGDLPYWNWHHAVDTCQFAALELISVKDTVPARDIFLVLIAALFHDVGHDGFVEQVHEDAVIPSDILYKTVGVREIHHCNEMINICSRDEMNLLSGIRNNKSVWRDVFTLIQATDMAKHFQILKKYDELEADLDEDNFRVLFLQIVLKAADLSSCCRSFEEADAHRQHLCEEFFATGDLDAVKTFVYHDNAYGDRTKLDKEMSVIPFYKEVCVPLFNALSRAGSQYDENAAQLELNVMKWRTLEKQRLAEQENAREVAKEETNEAVNEATDEASKEELDE